VKAGYTAQGLVLLRVEWLLTMITSILSSSNYTNNTGELKYTCQNMPIYYDPPSLEDDISDIPVSSVYVCATKPKDLSTEKTSGESTSSLTSNNWILHLATTKTDSVELNPTVGTDSILRLVISRQPNRASLNKRVDLAVSEGVHVGNIIELLHKHKHDYYRFTAEGKGQGHWIKTTLALLFSVGYLVDESEVQEAKMALQNIWDCQSSMEIGTFFDPEEGDTKV
jgi:hypothetical protein